ncbi:hypothetical protein ABLN87_21690 [Ruegeria sp. SCPT10]|uniref:hypothetical protein n=1 Tax=Ruegeria sp. SCP10 TaxID=3141377 RepID=UPI003337CE3E
MDEITPALAQTSRKMLTSTAGDEDNDDYPGLRARYSAGESSAMGRLRSGRTAGVRGDRVTASNSEPESRPELRKLAQSLQPLKRNQGIPDYLIAAENELFRAIGVLEHEGSRASRETLNTFSRALANYTKRSADFLYRASKSDSGPVDPSIKRSSVNVLSSVVGNIGFALPAAVSTGAELYMRNNGVSRDAARQIGDGVFAAGLMLTIPSAGASGSVRHRLGGAETQVLLPSGNSAGVGPIKSKAGGLVDSIIGTTVYSGARAGLLKLAESRGWDSTGKTLAGQLSMSGRAYMAAAGASLAMGVAKEVIYAPIAKLTIHRNGADNSHAQPIAVHNRSAVAGVQYSETPNLSKGAGNEGWSGNTTRMLITETISTLFACAAEYGVDQLTEESDGSASGEFRKVMATFSAFFAAKSVASAAMTRLFNHPALHANKHIKASQQVMVAGLQESSMKRFENAAALLASKLDAEVEASETLDDAKADYELVKKIFSSPALMGVSKIEIFREGASRFEELGARLSDASHDTGAAELAEIGNYLCKAAHSLSTAADYQQLAEDGRAGQERPEEPRTLDVYVKNAQRRLRDAQAIVAQVQTQEEGVEKRSANGALRPILPLLAGLSTTDKIGQINNLTGLLVDFRPQKAGRFRSSGWFRDRKILTQANVIVDALSKKSSASFPSLQFAEHAIATGQKLDTLLSKLEQAVNWCSKDTKLAEAKIAIIRNRFAMEGCGILGDVETGDQEQVTASRRNARKTIRTALTIEKQGGWNRNRDLSNLRRELGRGSFSFEHLAEELRRSRNAIRHRGEVETGPSENRPVIVPLTTEHDLRNAFGHELFDTILDEYPNPTSEDEFDIATVRAFEALGQDLAKMHFRHQPLWEAAHKTNQVFDRAPMETIEQNDAHYHPTSYSGAVNDLEMLQQFMRDNGVLQTNAAGIPSQLAHTRPDHKYYAAEVKPNRAGKALIDTMLGPSPEFGLRYRSHDEALGSDLINTIRHDPNKGRPISLSITGIDLTDKPTIGKSIDLKLAQYPRLFKSVGEVTWIKEIVSELNPEIPNIPGPASKQMLRDCSDRGLPIILHCDRGTPTNKNKYTSQVVEVLTDWIEEVNGEEGIHRADPLFDSVGGPSRHLPRRKAMISWAHGAGISRFTPDSRHHTRDLNELLSNEKLKSALFVDLSWDFIAHDILQNTRDLLVKTNVPEDMRHGMRELQDGLDAIVKSYQAFSEAGSLSDTAADIGDENLSALHRVSSNKIAQLHLTTLAAFKDSLDRLISEDPRFADVLESLMVVHGNNGNNWLNVLNEHSDRLMFGTDALAVGTKAHGEAAYSVNTKTLYPIYHMFLAVGTARGREEGAPFMQVVDNVARDTFDRFFNDEEMQERREAWEDMLKAKGADWGAELARGNRLSEESTIAKARRANGLRPRRGFQIDLSQPELIADRATLVALDTGKNGCCDEEH